VGSRAARMSLGVRVDDSRRDNNGNGDRAALGVVGRDSTVHGAVSPCANRPRSWISEGGVNHGIPFVACSCDWDLDWR